MGPRLSGLTSIFGVVFFVSKSPVGIERQKKLEKFAILTRKPRSPISFPEPTCLLVSTKTRSPCLGADQKASGLWERDCSEPCLNIDISNVAYWKHRLGLESGRAALCKWASCTRQTFFSKTFAKSLNMQKQYEKNVWENGNDASIRVQTTRWTIFRFLRFMFLRQHQRQRKMFSFRARAEKGIARHIREF